MNNFMLALEIMGKGMLGIFTVLGILTIIVFILTKFDSKNNKEEDRKE